MRKEKILELEISSLRGDKHFLNNKGILGSFYFSWWILEVIKRRYRLYAMIWYIYVRSKSDKRVSLI